MPEEEPEMPLANVATSLSFGPRGTDGRMKTEGLRATAMGFGFSTEQSEGPAVPSTPGGFQSEGDRSIDGLGVSPTKSTVSKEDDGFEAINFVEPEPGVRWRQDSEPVAVAPTKPESGEEETSLWKFMNAKAVVTKDRRNHWLDMKNNRLPSGALQKGIRQRYMEWCEQKEEMPVESLHLDPLSDESEEKGLTAWALTNDCNYQEVEVQKILHCSLAPEPNLVLDCRQLIADFLEVLVDIVVLISPALLCCLNALGAQ